MAKQKSQSAAHEVLISPRSVGIDANQRLAELKQSRALAEALIESLQSASGELVPATTATSVPINIVQENLASVIQGTALLRQSLLRALIHSPSPQFSTVIAGVVDDVVFVNAWADQAASKLSQGAQTNKPA